MTDLSRRQVLAQLAAAGVGTGAALVAGAACSTPQGDKPTMPTNPPPQAPLEAAPLPATELVAADPKADAVVRLLDLGSPPWPTQDPFLFCVHHNDAYPAGNGAFGPAESLAGRQIGQDFANKDGWNMYHGERVPGFPSHPHRGFETVTVVRQGLVDHSDSMGAAARYGQGDVQWLTAGRGIQHAEMMPLLRQDAPNPLELFQIWLNLPAKDKMAEPHFTMLWGPTIPRRTYTDAAGRATEIVVMAGSYDGMVPPAPPPSSWGARPESDLAIWTLKLAPGAQWTLPAAKKGTMRSLYVYEGQTVQLGPRHVAKGKVAELKGDVAVVLVNGPQEAQLLLLQGRPIGEPVSSYGPFVMNTRAEIQQAFSDYQKTRFGGWPWPDSAPVHGTQGRFARRPDGKVEKAG